MIATSNNNTYLLMTSNDLSTLITYVQLKENSNVHNYDKWSNAINMALEANDKLCFIDGTISKPHEGDPKLKMWWNMILIIGSWLWNTIKPFL